jgi:hypothetical protein
MIVFRQSTLNHVTTPTGGTSLTVATLITPHGTFQATAMSKDKATIAVATALRDTIY